jgi:hypothetical protein
MEVMRMKRSKDAARQAKDKETTFFRNLKKAIAAQSGRTFCRS